MKCVGFFLFAIIFFTTVPAKAISPFKEFKNDFGSSTHIKLMAIVEPEIVNSRDQFALHIKIEVDDGWHIYSLNANSVEEESLATKIILNSKSFLPQGSWKEPAPTIGWDGALERIVKLHNKAVEFRRLYSISESLTSGIHQIKGSIIFRACNNKVCTLANKISFNTEINVLAGGA